MDGIRRGPVARGPWDAETIRHSLLLYAVTDRSWLAERTLAQCVGEAIEGGASFIQLREKTAGWDEKAVLAAELLRICHAAGVPFVIDDDVALAGAAGADGVHVGQHDLACAEARRLLGDQAIVGVSVQTVEEARQAWEEGADYLGVGAMHPTATKPDAVDVTFEELGRICEAVPIPVVAIGGMDAENVSELAGTGAAGAAVVSALFAADDCRAAAQRLHLGLVRALGGEEAR